MKEELKVLLLPKDPNDYKRTVQASTQITE